MARFNASFSQPKALDANAGALEQQCQPALASCRSTSRALKLTMTSNIRKGESGIPSTPAVQRGPRIGPGGCQDRFVLIAQSRGWRMARINQNQPVQRFPIFIVSCQPAFSDCRIGREKRLTKLRNLDWNVNYELSIARAFVAASRVGMQRATLLRAHSTEVGEV